MALVSQVAQSASLTKPADVKVTGDDDTSGTVTKALALLTRYFPTELVAPYAAVTAVLPEVKPSAETIKHFAERTPPVGASDIASCHFDYDGRLPWFIGFAVLAFAAVPLINATRDVPASWKMVVWIDAPIALLAFSLWGLALPKSPLESACGSSVDAIQIGCAVLGGFLIPVIAVAAKKTIGKRWVSPGPPPPPTDPVGG